MANPGWHEWGFSLYNLLYKLLHILLCIGVVVYHVYDNMLLHVARHVNVKRMLSLAT